MLHSIQTVNVSYALDLGMSGSFMCVCVHVSIPTYHCTMLKFFTIIILINVYFLV